jgi:hypothetical protein
MKIKISSMRKLSRVLLILVLTISFETNSFSFSLGDGLADGNYGWNKRISFFVGAGPSFVFQDIYELPVIDKTSNFVKIEKASGIRPNMSAGIVFTPFVYNVTRTIKYIDDDGTEQEKVSIEYEPKHFSIALFINPTDISSTSNGLSSLIDMGLGLGWRSDNFSIFMTYEFFSLRQPRDYFISTYKENNKQFILNTEIQNVIDPNDNSVFTDVVFTSFGIKLAYTFDIVSNFSSAKKNDDE